MNEFFERLGMDFSSAAGRRGAAIEPPQIDPRVALELLDLARVTAHASERRFAPLSCYMAGVAAERLRAGRSGVDDSAVAELIHEVRVELEQR